MVLDLLSVIHIYMLYDWLIDSIILCVSFSSSHHIHIFSSAYLRGRNVVLIEGCSIYAMFSERAGEYSSSSQSKGSFFILWR